MKRVRARALAYVWQRRAARERAARKEFVASRNRASGCSGGGSGARCACSPQPPSERGHNARARDPTDCANALARATQTTCGTRKRTIEGSYVDACACFLFEAIALYVVAARSSALLLFKPLLAVAVAACSAHTNARERALSARICSLCSDSSSCIRRRSCPSRPGAAHATVASRT